VVRLREGRIPGMTLRWGILGPGRIAPRIVRAVRASSRSTLTAVASRDAGRAATFAATHGIPHSFGSYEGLLASPDVDVVYIALPNHLHASWSVRALEAGKHVLCEKPLATTVADAERMAEACERAGVVLMEAFMYRHHPSWVALRDLVTNGRIGRLMAVQTWFSFYNDDPTNIRNIPEAGGGALFDIGCYAVNLSRMLFDAEPTTVLGSLRRDETGTDVLTSAILGFPAGDATFTCSTRAEDDQRVHVHGSTGRIWIDIPFNIPPDRPTTIHLASGGDPPVAPSVETFTLPPMDPYTAEAAAFAASVLDGTPVPVPVTDAIANLRVIEQLFAAGRS
jgi:predicted dehydrogenase